MYTFEYPDGGKKELGRFLLDGKKLSFTPTGWDRAISSEEFKKRYGEFYYLGREKIFLSDAKRWLENLPNRYHGRVWVELE